MRWTLTAGVTVRQIAAWGDSAGRASFQNMGKNSPQLPAKTTRSGITTHRLSLENMRNGRTLLARAAWDPGRHSNRGGGRKHAPTKNQTAHTHTFFICVSTKA